MSSLFSPSSLMIAETLAIPVKFNHICFCRWRPATRCQEFTTPLFSSVTSLLCKANVISGSVSILTSPFWLWPWLCWHCFTDMAAELTHRFGKRPTTLNAVAYYVGSQPFWTKGLQLTNTIFKGQKLGMLTTFHFVIPKLSKK